jgi:hypothetical protein
MGVGVALLDRISDAKVWSAYTTFLGGVPECEEVARMLGGRCRFFVAPKQRGRGVPATSEAAARAVVAELIASAPNASDLVENGPVVLPASSRPDSGYPWHELVDAAAAATPTVAAPAAAGPGAPSPNTDPEAFITGLLRRGGGYVGVFEDKSKNNRTGGGRGGGSCVSSNNWRARCRDKLCLASPSSNFSVGCSSVKEAAEAMARHMKVYVSSVFPPQPSAISD